MPAPPITNVETVRITRCGRRLVAVIPYDKEHLYPHRSEVAIVPVVNVPASGILKKEENDEHTKTD